MEQITEELWGRRFTLDDAGLLIEHVGKQIRIDLDTAALLLLFLRGVDVSGLLEWHLLGMEEE